MNYKYIIIYLFSLQKKRNIILISHKYTIGMVKYYINILLITLPNILANSLLRYIRRELYKKILPRLFILNLKD